MSIFALTSGTSSKFLTQHMQMLESFSAGVIWLDENGNILGLNALFAKALGQEKAAFEKKSIFQIAPTLLLSEWIIIWKQLLQNKQTTFYSRFDAPTGTLPLSMDGALLEIEEQKVCFATLNLHSRPAPWESFLRLNKIGSWQWNFLKNQFLLSDAASQILEIPAKAQTLNADLLRDTLKERLYPKEYARLREQLKSCVLQGAPADVEFSMLMPSTGKEKRFRVVATPSREEEKIADIYGTVQDITKIIDRTEEMYFTQYCLDNIGEMVYWVNKNGNIIFANYYMCKMLGYNKKELLSMKIMDLRSDFNETRWKFQWEEFPENKMLELRFKCKDGRELPVHVTGYYLKYRGQEVACSFGKDLSQEKRREEMLRLARYSLNNTQEMVYWIRADGSFYYFNDAFATKLGYTREEVKKKRLLDFFPNFQEEDFLRGWDRLQNGEILSSELQINHRNGFHIYVQSYITLISIDGEKCACGILSDISERKRKEEELHIAFAEIKKLREQSERNNRILHKEQAENYYLNNIISISPAYKKVLKQIEWAAQTDTPVLLLGENGTGKELLARSLHQLNRRANQPLVKINCSMIPEHLLESELFGYEKDAFPGAFESKPGKFEQAQSGTVFFNEIGDIPLHLQEKILILLQNGELKRLGSNETITLDVRVIAATNKNPEELIREGKLRQDFFYWLNVFPIHNIPLRERREDIPLLARHFVEKYTRQLGKPIIRITEKALDLLREYQFPGNIRELENIIERAIIRSNGSTLEVEEIFFNLSTSGTMISNFLTLEQMQREHILHALRLTRGQITGENGAAKLLGMNDKTLYSKMKKLNIERRDYLYENHKKRISEI